MASYLGSDTVPDVRRVLLLLTPMLVAGVLAVVAAVALSGGGAADSSRPSVSTQASVSVPLRPDATGPGCLGGLCVDDLPASIPYSDVSAYLTTLRDGLAADTTPDGANRCHTVSHEIGRRAAGASSVIDLLQLDDGRCLYGYQHGVLEGWSAAVDLTTLVAGIPTACSPYRGDRTAGGLGPAEMGYAAGSCAHGIGHAIALQGVGSVAAAVAYCDGVDDGQRGGCAGGVFMAYAEESASQGEYAPKRRLELDRAEVVGLCSSLEGAYRVECWSKLWLLGSRVGLDADGVAALCPTDGPDAEICGKGVGEALVYESSFDHAVAVQRCPSGALQDSCMAGAAWANANAHVGSGGSRESYQSVCPAGTGGAACRELESSALDGAVR
jgi:hypothetical protein